jgi:uncharacterized protein YdhG (YjbR/CyaY superfamily)
MKIIEQEMQALGVGFTIQRNSGAGEKNSGAGGRGAKFATIDEYIGGFPEPARTKLMELRGIIKAAAPDAAETFSYGMPALYLNGNLVYFAGFARHVGFYPTASGIAAFHNEIQSFKNSKGAVQFPLDRPLPKTLITRIVKFRVKENLSRLVKPERKRA